MSGHRKFWASLWCHTSTVSLVFKFSWAFLEIFRNVFAPITSVMKFWSLCDAIFLWCTGSGSLGPVVPSQDYSSSECSGWIWGDWVSIKEVVHQGPEDSHQPSAGAGGVQPLRQDVLIRFLALSSRSFFCYTTQSHLFQTVSVSVWERLTVVTLVSIFVNLCYIFFLFQKFFLYTVWRRKPFIQRTKFFLGWILSRERVSGQGHMFGAAGPVKLDLYLEDFLEPGVRQLWRSNWWSYGWVWGLSGTSFPPPADLQVSGKWRGQDCCWCGCSLRITCPVSVLSLSN